MLFNSFDFLLFFMAVFMIYYSIGQRYRWILLLACSYYFYFSWEPALLLLLVGSTVLDYFCGIGIHKAKIVREKRFFLGLSISINVGLLCFFKYLGFFSETTMTVLEFFGGEVSPDKDAGYQFEKIFLPIGISFYTFQTLSYSIDIYKKRITPTKHFGKYALYVSFFPQLVAGPIERASRLLPQFDKTVAFDSKRIRQGFVMMGWGYFLKLVVADRLGIYVDHVFAYPMGYNSKPLVLGSYFFTLQIYYDFSAYSTIALGAAKVLGFDLMQNFNRPMFFKSMSDFWKRWHISLMNWLGVYIYTPLARNRKIPRALILCLVFFINGLWHGANWTFVIWGLLCGFYLIFETFVRAKLFLFCKAKNLSFFNKSGVFIWWVISVNFLAFSLIFFRAPSIEIAFTYFRQIMVNDGSGITSVLKDSIELSLCFLLISIVQYIHFIKGNDRVHEIVTQQKWPKRWLIYMLFIFAIVFLSINRQNNFIYFQF